MLTGTKVDLATAKARLRAHSKEHGTGPHRAASLANVIWPDGRWLSEQGAGAAASRVVKRLGGYWHATKANWGWMLSFPD